MKTNLCIPRLRSGNNGNNKNKTPAMTLLERFREAVFRLIMLSALSKAATTTTRNDHHHHQAHVSRSYYNPADPHHSEAVAECIEFIKKKALTDDEDYDHNNSASDTDDSISIDATNTTELVMQVPVM